MCNHRSVSDGHREDDREPTRAFYAKIDSDPGFGRWAINTAGGNWYSYSRAMGRGGRGGAWGSWGVVRRK